MRRSTKQRTENLLKYIPATRSDDKLLQILYMDKAGIHLTDEQVRIFYDMGDLWDVRRYRQKFQQLGLYPPTAEVEKKRFENYRRIKDGIVSDQPEVVLENILPDNYEEHQWKEY